MCVDENTELSKSLVLLRGKKSSLEQTAMQLCLSIDQKMSELTR